MVYSYKYAKAFGIFLKTGVISTVYLTFLWKLDIYLEGFFFSLSLISSDIG